jgi:acetate---CoA ligase (ADP-forming)
MRDIQPLVAPRSIAVIGASTNPNKSGGVLFSNLAGGKLRGKLYPINPNATEVMGLKAYPSVGAIPEKVDLVYIVLPSQHVEAAIEQCIAAGARAACIITAGFAEAGPEGRVLQDRIQKQAQAAGMLLAGPNTIGMVNTECGMMGSFVNFPRWESGPISLFTQTGIFTGALMRQIMDSDVQRLPASKSIDVGNKIDVHESDFLAYAANDPGTRVIGLYIESIVDLPRFVKQARMLRGVKPIVMLKTGRTAAGRFASAAHTGSPPSDDAAIRHGLRDSGVLRVDDEEDFVNTLRALAMLPKPKGPRVGIATTSGALGVIASDLVEECGLELAEFEAATIERMRTIVPPWLPPVNPYDFWIGIDVKGAREAHEVGLSAVFADPNVDLVLCTLLAPPNADFPEMGELLRRLRREHDKPVALVPYGSAAARWTREIEGGNIPVFPTVRAGVRALSMVASTIVNEGELLEPTRIPVM